MLIETSTEGIDLWSLTFVRRLYDNNFPLLLLQDDLDNLYVVKLFAPGSKSFANEAKLHGLTHPNFIRTYAVEPHMRLQVLQGLNPASGILMEYAQNGDLWDLLHGLRSSLSDAGVRTLFGQMLDAVEYLHLNGFAHMDIKPENMLLSADYCVKMADFDQVALISEPMVTSKGTRGYRAPEVRSGNCQDAEAADVFSMGVTLFYLKVRVSPFEEGKTFEGVDLYEELMKDENERFWKIFEKAKKEENFFDEGFRNLVKWMMARDPKERPSIVEIRESEWFKGPKLAQKELKEELIKLRKTHM